MWKIWLGCAVVATLLCAPDVRAETRAAAVVDDGYAGGVLRKIMAKYAGSPGKGEEAKLFLDEEGRLLDCRALKGDVKALCQAARAGAPFGEPPYGVQTSIVVAMWSGKGGSSHAARPEPASKADAKYLDKIRRQLRNAMYIPEKTKPGVYHATARVKCDGAGKILDSAIVKSSGDKLLDKYVLRGISRAGSVTAPPDGAGGSFDIIFTLKR